jgi:hypothetical protein
MNCLLLDDDDLIIGSDSVGFRNRSLFRRLTSLILPLMSDMLISLRVLDSTELGFISRYP